jgi:hypothetical protein
MDRTFEGAVVWETLGPRDGPHRNGRAQLATAYRKERAHCQWGTGVGAVSALANES